jgi:hypothetical protein
MFDDAVVLEVGVLLLRKIAGMLEQRLLAVRSLQHRERERDLRARDDRLAACVKKLRKKTTVEPPKKAEKVGPAKSTFCSMIWRRERDSNPRNRFGSVVFKAFQGWEGRQLLPIYPNKTGPLLHMGSTLIGACPHQDTDKRRTVPQ